MRVNVNVCNVQINIFNVAPALKTIYEIKIGCPLTKRADLLSRFVFNDFILYYEHLYLHNCIGCH